VTATRSEAVQGLCFLAGANAVFYVENLGVTTAASQHIGQASRYSPERETELRRAPFSFVRPLAHMRGAR
jgi:hypothetical protein